MKRYAYSTIGIATAISLVFGFYFGIFLENAGLFDWVDTRLLPSVSDTVTWAKGARDYLVTMLTIH
jgi:hypothetical protein